ncbi:MAG TPA: hypothetical protein VHG93_14490, partial [Longimicrobium sp.]|nr:hypothetical protein [Longimicrobium sp.]
PAPDPAPAQRGEAVRVVLRVTFGSGLLGVVGGGLTGLMLGGGAGAMAVFCGLLLGIGGVVVGTILAAGMMREDRE